MSKKTSDKCAQTDNNITQHQALLRAEMGRSDSGATDKDDRSWSERDKKRKDLRGAGAELERTFLYSSNYSSVFALFFC